MAETELIKPGKKASRKTVERYAIKLYDGNESRAKSYVRGWFSGNFAR